MRKSTHTLPLLHLQSLSLFTELYDLFLWMHVCVLTWHAFIIIIMHAAFLLSGYAKKKDFVELVRSHKDAFTPMLVLYSKLHKVFDHVRLFTSEHLRMF
jgi:hypothetical protein